MKLSIITINYNNLEGLKETVESVMSQTWRDFEWIIVDGGSTDGSKGVIEEVAKNPEANVSWWCSERDKGIYNAMNKGIVRATGEYCLFLNSGDYFVDGDVLDKVFAIEFDEDVVYGYSLYNKGNHFETSCRFKDITLKTLLVQGIHHSGNVFIRLDAFEKWGLYDESLFIVSDFKWFLQAIGLNTATTRYIDILLSVFDCTGISETERELNIREREDVCRALIPNRILKDYKKFISEEDLYLEGIAIRNSISYKLGDALLKPIKIIRNTIRKRRKK